MEEVSPDARTNIVASIEEVEQELPIIEEPEEVPEKSILKPKPKKLRSKAQQVAFLKCQEARREKLADKKSSKPPVSSPVKDVESHMPIKKVKRKKKTVIDMNILTESSSEEEEPEILYIKRKKRKSERPKRIVKL